MEKTPSNGTKKIHMTKLNFTPLNEDDINKLLAHGPLVDKQVTNVRVTQWLVKDKPTEYLFGIDIEHENKWIHMMYGKRAVVFSNKKHAGKVYNLAKQQLNTLKEQ